MRLQEVPTPALCVDLDTLLHNIEVMASYFSARSCGLRPHVKAHKTPAIARLQAEAGCEGFTCATVTEAEVMARHGFDDLLVANEVVDPTKRERLRSLAERVRLSVAVDSTAGIGVLAGTRASVLVDTNVGLPRCGVQPDGVVGLARAAAEAGLEVAGVMGYEGHAMAIQDTEARSRAARESMDVLCDAARRLRADGFAAPVVSAGGTGTYDVTGEVPGVTEVQAGSYALMDTTYAKYGLPFAEALRCLTTVLSVQGPIAVCDAGLKSLATDHGNPDVTDTTAAEVLFLSDEHTTLVVSEGFDRRPGDRMWLRPSHVDPTVNLHDRLYAVRDEEVIDVWQVEARGWGPVS